MVALGLDIGGSKVEAQIFDSGWNLLANKRVKTPGDRTSMLEEISNLILWAEKTNSIEVIGLAAPGFNLVDKNLLSINLGANSQQLVVDLELKINRRIEWINDARAFTVSEAILGAGQYYQAVMGLVLGTGVGAGFVINGSLVSDAHSNAGEVGHISAPLSVCRELPILDCKCGRTCCYEVYISGSGLSKLVHFYAGKNLHPEEINVVKKTEPKILKAWEKWCHIVAELIITSASHLNTDIVVLGGGLSKMDDVIEDLTNAVNQRALSSVKQPKIVLAEAGDASGARGAAYAAYLKDRRE